MTETRPCTCAPDERPYPCQHQYALGLCRKQFIRSLIAERNTLQADLAAARERVAELEQLESAMKRELAGLCPYPAHGRPDDLSISACVSTGECGCRDGEGEKLRIAEADLAAARDELRCQNEANDMLATERDVAVSSNTYWVASAHDEKRRAKRAESELAAARALLHRLEWFAKHYPNCPMWGATGDEVCDCGLSEVLVQVNKHHIKAEKEST